MISERIVAVDKKADEINKRVVAVDKKVGVVSERASAVDKKIDDLSDSVGEALHNFDTTTHDQLQNHETRLTTLEATA